MKLHTNKNKTTDRFCPSSFLVLSKYWITQNTNKWIDGFATIQAFLLSASDPLNLRACRHLRISLQFRQRKCDFLEAPFGSRLDGARTGSIKAQSVTVGMGSDRTSLRFQQRGLLPTVDSYLKSVFHRRFTLLVELTVLQVDPIGWRSV